MEITSCGRQLVTRVFCPACHKTGRKNIRKTGTYKGFDVDYYRCLHCVMKNSRKPFTFAVEVIDPKSPFIRTAEMSTKEHGDA